MNDEIRKVQPGDEEKLAFIQVESWREAYGDILPQEVLKKYLDLDYVTAIYRKLLKDKKGNGLMMQVDGEDHCIAYWDKARGCTESDTAEIICFHSLKRHWRNGFGSKMMKKLCEDITAQGYRKVLLWVFEKNKRARSFYEANGFQMTGPERADWLWAKQKCVMKGFCVRKNNFTNSPQNTLASDRSA